MTGEEMTDRVRVVGQVRCLRQLSGISRGGPDWSAGQLPLSARPTGHLLSSVVVSACGNKAVTVLGSISMFVGYVCLSVSCRGRGAASDNR